jgi:hypothetical protein
MLIFNYSFEELSFLGGGILLRYSSLFKTFFEQLFLQLFLDFLLQDDFSPE